MRKVAVALLSVIVVGLMLAMPVSAGKAMVVVVPDREGDLGMYNVLLVVGPTPATQVPDPRWQDNTPVGEASYMDMVSVSIAMVRSKYVFSMELVGDLPPVGDPLPSGSRYAGWMWWLETGPWDPMSAIIPKTYFQVCLELDESGYSAGIYDVQNDWAYTPAQFTIDGATFQIEVPEKMLGGLESFWWSAGTWFAKEYMWAWPWFVDMTDPGNDQGQVGYDFPWPPV